MIYKDVIIAGFGGQGVLLAGKLLAWAGMLEGRRVTWFPSYGAEIRGGTANCTVVISDEDIGSPVVDKPAALIALNQASADRFAVRVDRGGVILLNSSLVKKDIKLRGVKVLKLPANDIAGELGDLRIANMVMLGAYLKASGVLSLASVCKALDEVISARNKSVIPLNKAALERGFSMV
jgi:2-oxoglutarate ferredoxin oxidoreductase subunit gamma